MEIDPIAAHERLQRLFLLCSHAGNIEQRDVMIWRRNGGSIVGMLGQLKNIARCFDKLLSHSIIEPLRPIECGIRLVPLDAAEVVNDVPAPNDHDPALA
jgi:hypothetical protein